MAVARKLNNDDRRRFIASRRAFNKPVIGITGNLGKTSTIDILRTILDTKGKLLYPSNGNGKWKDNIQLLEKLNQTYDYAVFEFDYQQGNQFAELLRLIKPNIGIVTNIGDSHLSYLGDIMKIALEKSVVVKYLARDGVAILNKDDELTSALSDYIATPHIVKYGLSQGAHFQASDIQLKGPHGMTFTLNGTKKIALPIYGIQDVYNVLAAIASAVNLNFALNEVIDILEDQYQIMKGRGRVISFAHNYLIDESYISTPRSLAKAARTLIGFKNYVKQLYLIVGDMVGTGVNTEEQHLNMGYFLSALPIDGIITIGEYARFIAQGAQLIPSENKQVISAKNVDEIIAVLKKQTSGNIAVLVKGIGSMALHRISKFLEEYAR